MKIFNKQRCESCPHLCSTPFSRLSPEYLNYFSLSKETRAYSPKDIIWNEISLPEDLYILSEGTLKVEFEDENYFLLARKGELLGGAQFFENKKQRVKIVSLTPSRICVLRKASLDKLLTECPECALDFVEHFIQKANEIHKNYDLFLKVPLEQRYAQFLMTEFKTRQSIKNDLPFIQKILSQNEVGTLLNARRESISRLNSKLQKDGILDFSEGGIFLLDIERLKGLATQ